MNPESTHETGRRIILTSYRCPDCQGEGENAYSNPCESCDRGEVVTYRFADSICSDFVEMCEHNTACMDGGKGFIAETDENVFWLGGEELAEMIQRRALSQLMRNTDHLMTIDEMRAA